MGVNSDGRWLSWKRKCNLWWAVLNNLSVLIIPIQVDIEFYTKESKLGHALYLFSITSFFSITGGDLLIQIIIFILLTFSFMEFTVWLSNLDRGCLYIVISEESREFSSQDICIMLLQLALLLLWRSYDVILKSEFWIVFIIL